MKKFLTLLLAFVMGIACLGMGGCNQQQGKTLYVYTNAGFAPYEYINTKGEVVGVDIEIMQEIGRILGYNVVINDIEFNQIFDEVSKNEYAVGAAGITQKTDRDAVANPSISYASSVQSLIAPAGSLDAYLDGSNKVSLDAIIAAFGGETIGYQKGTTGADMILDRTDGTTVSTLEYPNAIVAASDIGTSLKAVIIDKLPAESIANGNPNLQSYELSEEAEQYVLYLNKNATELLADINTILDAMINTGYINYLTYKHMGNIDI